MKELLDTHWKDKTVCFACAPTGCSRVLSRLAQTTRQVVFVGDSINSLVYHAAVRATCVLFVELHLGVDAQSARCAKQRRSTTWQLAAAASRAKTPVLAASIHGVLPLGRSTQLWQCNHSTLFDVLERAGWPSFTKSSTT